MKKLLSISLILSSILLCSCYKICPAFPEYLNDYFPYKKTYMYQNGKNDTIKFCTEDYYLSEEEICDKGLFSKCICNPGFDQSIQKSEYDYCGYRFNYKIILLKGKSKILIHSYWWEPDLEHHMSSFVYIVDGINPYREENSALFGEVLELYPQDGNTRFISRIKVERGKGVVEFDDNLNDCTWYLIDK